MPKAIPIIPPITNPPKNASALILRPWLVSKLETSPAINAAKNARPKEHATASGGTKRKNGAIRLTGGMKYAKAPTSKETRAPNTMRAIVKTKMAKFCPTGSSP